MYPTVLIHVTPSPEGGDMDSENLIGADNQQERSGIEQWVVGFVDGEGCVRSAKIADSRHDKPIE